MHLPEVLSHQVDRRTGGNVPAVVPVLCPRVVDAPEGGSERGDELDEHTPLPSPVAKEKIGTPPRVHSAGCQAG